MANKTAQSDLRTTILNSAVRSLKEFGYPSVNAENIITDRVYCRFFKSQLLEAKGYRKDVDVVIDELLKEIGDE